MTKLERRVERALYGGLALSALLLVGGLLRGSDSALGWGFVMLMLTPVVRVLVLTIALLWQGDWLFGFVCLFVLCVLTGGIVIAGFKTWPHSLPFF